MYFVHNPNLPEVGQPHDPISVRETAKYSIGAMAENHPNLIYFEAELNTDLEADEDQISVFSGHSEEPIATFPISVVDNVVQGVWCYDGEVEPYHVYYAEESLALVAEHYPSFIYFVFRMGQD